MTEGDGCPSGLGLVNMNGNSSAENGRNQILQGISNHTINHSKTFQSWDIHDIPWVINPQALRNQNGRLVSKSVRVWFGSDRVRRKKEDNLCINSYCRTPKSSIHSLNTRTASPSPLKAVSWMDLVTLGTDGSRGCYHALSILLRVRGSRCESLACNCWELSRVLLPRLV